MRSSRGLVRTGRCRYEPGPNVSYISTCISIAREIGFAPYIACYPGVAIFQPGTSDVRVLLIGGQINEVFHRHFVLQLVRQHQARVASTDANNSELPGFEQWGFRNGDPVGRAVRSQVIFDAVKLRRRNGGEYTHRNYKTRLFRSWQEGYENGRTFWLSYGSENYEN